MHRIRASLMVMLVGASMATTNQGSLATPSVPDQDTVEHAIAFRDDFGLKHGQDYVEATYGDPRGFPDMTWGIPMSPSEVDEMKARIRFSTELHDAIEFARGQDGFAGFYIRQTDPVSAWFFFTDDVADMRTRIGELAPRGGVVHVEHADHTMAELEELKDRIGDDYRELVAGGLEIETIDADEETNSVMVGLTKASEEGTAMLRERYGPLVGTTSVGPTRSDACTGRSNCRPLMGGLKIHPTGYSSASWCSSAYQAEKANGQRVLLTAGHCLEDFAAHGGDWDNDGHFGNTGGDTLHGSTAPADIGWILIDSGETISPANRFFASDHNDIRSMVFVQSDADQNVGDQVCRSAKTTGWQCGKIANTDQLKSNGSGQMIDHTWVMNVDAQGGDSGGVVVASRVIITDLTWGAAGDHVHSSEDGSCSGTDCRAWWSTAQSAQNSTVTDPVDLHICITSGC